MSKGFCLPSLIFFFHETGPNGPSVVDIISQVSVMICVFVNYVFRFDSGTDCHGLSFVLSWIFCGCLFIMSFSLLDVISTAPLVTGSQLSPSILMSCAGLTSCLVCLIVFSSWFYVLYLRSFSLSCVLSKHKEILWPCWRTYECALPNWYCAGSINLAEKGLNKSSQQSVLKSEGPILGGWHPCACRKIVRNFIFILAQS